MKTYNYEVYISDWQSNLLKRIDKLNTYSDKLELLNNMYLKAKTDEQEVILEQMIEDLKFYGK